VIFAAGALAELVTDLVDTLDAPSGAATDGKSDHRIHQRSGHDPSTVPGR
jgi:hypothetical protein